MRLPFLRSKDPAAERPARAAAGDEPQAVEAARTRARRRLIGALVLLVAGVIGFPLLFETQPRPLPVDTPIEVAPRELSAAPALRSLPGRPAGPPPEAGAEIAQAPASAAAPVPPAQAPQATERVAAAPPAASAAPATTPAARSTPTAVAPTTGPASAPRATAPPRSDDGARAQALLNAAGSGGSGSSNAAETSARFVVQVGAYSDAGTLREARQRVERLGFKTYTQVIQTSDGARTRVRIGPYAKREEADAAAAKLRGAGLPTSILAL